MDKVKILVGKSCGHVLQLTKDSPAEGVCFTCNGREVLARTIEVPADSKEALDYKDMNARPVGAAVPSGGNGRALKKEVSQGLTLQTTVSRTKQVRGTGLMPRPQPATELMLKVFPPLRWLVDGILCEGGLSVLAGKAKVGKSWLCLQLASAVASGEPFLGKQTEKSSVLYCALEDTERRVQRRLQQQGDAFPAGLDFIYKLPVVSGADGIGTLQLLITTYRYKMLILDTWAAAMGQGVDENGSTDMAFIFNNLRDVAHDTGCAIVVISHHGKLTNSDAVYDIRGSSAIGGAADTLIGLYKNRGEFQGILSLVSRETEDASLSLSFDKDTCTWVYRGDAKELAQSANEQLVLDSLRVLGEVDATSVAKSSEMTRQGVSNILKKLELRGLITSRQVIPDGGGKQIVYSLVGEGMQTAVARVASVAVDAEAIATGATIASE